VSLKIFGPCFRPSEARRAFFKDQYSPTTGRLFGPIIRKEPNKKWSGRTNVTNFKDFLSEPDFLLFRFEKKVIDIGFGSSWVSS
jgi:hypothetical protein